MKAKINNQECYVLLDNGTLWDELLFFCSSKVDSLGLNLTSEAYIGDSTVANPIIADVDTNVNIAFQDITFNNQKAIITRYIPSLPNLWEGADLQISAAFFKNFIVEINFDQLYIKLIPPKKFKYTGKGQELKMKKGPNNSRLINANITQSSGEEISIDLLIDLGGIHPLYLPIGKRDDIILPDNAVESVLASGFQGPVMGYMGRVKELKLGNYKLDSVLVAYANVEPLANEYGNTMLGIKLLQHFNITFDYPNERIFIEPSRKFNNRFHFNMTGFDLRPDLQGNLRVINVYHNSPAQKLGILPNDIITHINQTQIKDFKVGEIKTILMKEREAVTLSIQSEDQSKQVTIILHDII